MESIEECTTSFAAIIAQCCVDQSLDGGEIQIRDRMIYEVYIGSSEHHRDVLNEATIEGRGSRDDQDDMDDLLHLIGSRSLESRAGTKKPAALAKPPANKPGSKPLPIGKLKPTPTPDSTPDSTPSKPSSSLSSKAAPPKSCKQIYDLAFQGAVAEALELEQEETRLDGAAAMIRRDLYVGSMTSRRSILDLEKRTPNDGKGCGIAKFNALDYPEPAKMVSVQLHLLDGFANVSALL